MERQRSFLFFSFLFFSCDKSQEIKLPDGSDDMMKLMQGPHDTLTFTGSTDRTFTTADELHEFLAEQKKLSARHRSNDSEVKLAKTTTGPNKENYCDCYYRIIDITVPAHNSASFDTYLQFVGGNCNPTGIQTIYNRDHSATGECLTSGGTTQLPNLNPDPYELFPFDCIVPRYWSTGATQFIYFEHPTNCLSFNSVSTETNEVSLTFQIICSDFEPNPNLPTNPPCDDVQDGINGHSFVSPIVQMVIPAGGLDVPTTPFSLEGCGCQPTFN